MLTLLRGPDFLKARPVAYAPREKTERVLDRLVQEGTLEPVEFSEWATPIVPTVKEDGTILICGENKQGKSSSKVRQLPHSKD